MDFESYFGIENNKVEFYSNQVIENLDLGIILVFLENRAKSGGGDYIDFELDSTKKHLTIHYKSYETKTRVLEKRKIKIDNKDKVFNLIANEPFDPVLFELNQSVLILRIFQSTTEEFLNAFAENLVINDDNTNKIESINRSNFFDRIFIVKYKHNFDHEKVKIRFEKYRSFFQIEFIPAFTTKIVLVKTYDRNGNKIPKDFIEFYFANKNDFESYTSIHEREPFLFMLYDRQETCELICTVEHEANDFKFIVEPLHNYDLFEKELNKTQIEENKDIILLDDPVKIERSTESDQSIPDEDTLIEDQITDLQLYEIRILVEEMYTKQLKDRYPRMDVTLNLSRLCIMLRGAQHQVEDAKKLARDITKNIIHKDFPIDPFIAKFFHLKENGMINWLKENSIRCFLVPNPEDAHVRIYGINYERINCCFRLIIENISMKIINSHLTKRLNEIEVETFIRNYRDDCQVVIGKKNGFVYMCGLALNVNELFRNFLEEFRIIN